MKYLGTKVESMPVMCDKSNRPAKPSYPTFSIRDAALKEFLGGEKVEVGDEFEVTLKIRCCSSSDGEYGKSMDFEVLESDPLGMEDGPEGAKESKDGSDKD